jgi:hypothetical protein
MAIDWDDLVLSPCMDQFALNAPTFNPIKSQPGQPSYPARCVWEVVEYTVVEENAAPMSTSILKIGLRLNDFAVPPVQGDQVTIDNDTYTLDSFIYDGQGGVRWTVKSTAPGGETQYAS